MLNVAFAFFKINDFVHVDPKAFSRLRLNTKGSTAVRLFGELGDHKLSVQLNLQRRISTSFCRVDMSSQHTFSHVLHFFMFPPRDLTRCLSSSNQAEKKGSEWGQLSSKLQKAVHLWDWPGAGDTTPFWGPVEGK